MSGSDDIARVATISSGDEAIGKLIADAMEKVSADGVITLEESKTAETYSEVVEGMQFDRGYITPYMVTDTEKMEAVIDDAYILITDKKIASIQEILPLLEEIVKTGRKLLITGKGRCNVTNCCTVEDFMLNVLSNKRFLYSSLNALNPYEVMGFFEDCGVALKVERGERVFPVSDRSADIVDALVNKAQQSGCRITRACVKELVLDTNSEGKLSVCGVITEDGQTIHASSVIVATGGKSYPATGSTGDGYRLARQAGHKVTPLRPSLIPLVCKEKICRDMMGLSLKNVVLKVVDTRSGKEVFSELGEMLFTHFGVSV